MAIDKQSRDRMLDELLRETREWARKERERIQSEADFLRELYKARTGFSKLAESKMNYVSQLTSDSVKDLLGVEAVET